MSNSPPAPEVLAWMVAAAQEIDRKIGLPPPDGLAVGWAAEIIAHHAPRPADSKPQTPESKDGVGGRCAAESVVSP